MVLIPSTNVIVDNFREKPRGEYVYFLTHMHSDHFAGLSNTWNQGPIYCSYPTTLLLQAKFPKLHCVYPLELQATQWIEQAHLSVTLIEANHCPGAVMLLFSGQFGNVLHTGDFRFYPGLLSTPALTRSEGVCIRIDHLFIDNTFCSPKYSFPSQDELTSEIFKIIENTECDEAWLVMTDFGKIKLLKRLAKRFSTCIVVNEELLNKIDVLGLNEGEITSEEDGGWIKVVSKETARAISSEKGPVLLLKLSGWNSVTQRVNALYYKIPYTNHSSYPELQEFITWVHPLRLTFLSPFSHKPSGNFEIVEKVYENYTGVAPSVMLKRKAPQPAPGSIVKAKRLRTIGARIK